MERGHPCPQSVRSTLKSAMGTGSRFALMRAWMPALQSQSHIFKRERLALDATGRRRDPVGDLADFSYRLHQAAHVFAIFICRQPFRLLRCEFFFRNQIAFDVEVVSGIFTNVTMKTNIRQIEPFAA